MRETIEKCIIVCTTPRSGSNAFSDAMTSTGRLGFPKEYWKSRAAVNPVKRIFTDRFALVEKFLHESKTENGVAAIKLFPVHMDLMKGISAFNTIPQRTHVYLYTKDILGQAISLVRARQTSSWDSATPPKRDPFYHRKSIQKAISEISYNNARWLAYFARNGIEPISLQYEVASQNWQECIQTLFRETKIEPTTATVAKFQVQADSINKEWRERFLRESSDLETVEYVSPNRISLLFRDLTRDFTER